MVYIPFGTFYFWWLVVGNMHPAAAVGTPMFARGPSARSAGDKRHHREGRLQVGFGPDTPCFWLKYTPKRRFWKTRRLVKGVFFLGRLLQGVYFYGFAQCGPLPAPLRSMRQKRCSGRQPKAAGRWQTRTSATQAGVTKGCPACWWRAEALLLPGRGSPGDLRHSWHSQKPDGMWGVAVLG
jgi:hypothetical protein